MNNIERIICVVSAMVYPYGKFKYDALVEVDFEMNENHQRIFDILDKERDLPVYIKFINECCRCEERQHEIQTFILNNYCPYENYLKVQEQRNQQHNDVWYEYFLVIKNITTGR